MTSTWSTADIPSQAGRTVVVTGANSGLGLVTARELARAGARVVLAVRDPARGERAAATVSGDVEVRRLDLADLASVRAFAAGWSGDLDVLVNNAGIMMVPAGLTADGFERQLGTNHLGHFALTVLLLPHVTDRVVTLSSAVHKAGRIDLDDPHWQRRRYSPTGAYAQSKLANLLFTLELQRRLTASGSPVRALAAHPGWAATELQGRTGTPQRPAMRLGNALLAQSAEQGALPTLAAAVLDLPAAATSARAGWASGAGHRPWSGRSPAASDPEPRPALWVASAELTGVDLPVPAA
jgi:NAD(P)-dependent dehydrogenase (short-subunit alcohol dehydrogenase family)